MKKKKRKKTEIDVQQRKEEIKKKDEMTLNAIKYFLIAFSILFIFSLLGCMWQNFGHLIFPPKNQSSHIVFFSAGFLLSAKFWKKCHDNIATNHVLLRLYSIIIFSCSMFVGVCFLIWFAGDVLSFK